MSEKDQYCGQSPAEGIENPTRTQSQVGKVSHRKTSLEEIHGEQPSGQSSVDPGGSYGGSSQEQD